MLPRTSWHVSARRGLSSWHGIGAINGLLSFEVLIRSPPTPRRSCFPECRDVPLVLPVRTMHCNAREKELARRPTQKLNLLNTKLGTCEKSLAKPSKRSRIICADASSQEGTVNFTSHEKLVTHPCRHSSAATAQPKP
jgi:hypothetical protein